MTDFTEKKTVNFTGKFPIAFSAIGSNVKGFSCSAAISGLNTPPNSLKFYKLRHGLSTYILLGTVF